MSRPLAGRLHSWQIGRAAVRLFYMPGPSARRMCARGAARHAGVVSGVWLGDQRRNHVGNRAGNLAGAIFTRSTPPKWQCSSKPGYLRLRLVERAVLRRDVGPAC